jgi:hypothetical protein
VKLFIAQEYMFNIAVWTLHVQWLTQKVFTSVIYTMLHIKLSLSKNKYAPAKHVSGYPLGRNVNGTKQWAEGVNEETWEDREPSNKN